MTHYWTCQRVSKGVKCGAKNPARLRNCPVCGKAKPARKVPAHMSALDLPYEWYVVLNGGEHCGICFRKPSPTRRLDRDHEHRADGKPRGLLCFACNRQLRTWQSIEWMEAAIEYLRRANAA